MDVRILAWALPLILVGILLIGGIFITGNHIATRSNEPDHNYVDDIIADVTMVPGTGFFQSEPRLQITTEKGYHWTTQGMRTPIQPGTPCRVHLGYIYRIEILVPNHQ